ncbi:MAG: hypothetical protein OXG35_17220 [Acidobacteria bacterium]|nr:hypothetical protein [Acidobacteriota bacterium]
MTGSTKAERKAVLEALRARHKLRMRVEAVPTPAAALRARLEEDLLCAEELTNHWLATEPGARRLAAEAGRAALETLAERRRSLALDAGEAARLRGASWEDARAAAERRVYALD